MINPRELPVYQQKDRILEMLSLHQVIVIESPTGSGKTTQLPLILHEANYSQTGIIGITQPRRIAALSVSDYIAKQLDCSIPGIVGYKMRFNDQTDTTTRIKVMTDGILLQEMKLDPWLSKYSVIMVDEAHERSLNIDFILGLLKRILQERKDFKVIVSSATINTELFSVYFDDCPIVKIDAITYPVAIIYDPPIIQKERQSDFKTKKQPFLKTDVNLHGSSTEQEEALLFKILSTLERISSDGREGDVLVFLPGEKLIRNCIELLQNSTFARKLYILPLYGRLGKEEQEKVFQNAPMGKKKVIIATNIAETSITINGITSVIDSGLAKLNYYNPKTYTSSLMEMPISKASCNQRRGRAGRTREGTCYRLYSRKDFETRPLYTTEEIYRTDLSEVVLRMSELGIKDFESFDFINPPNKEGLRAAVKTLNLLDALNDDNSLSKIGQMMALFPLAPRQSRMIVESILNHPDVIENVLIASAFLSAQSPYLFPDGQETDARAAHKKFFSPQGDFARYLILFKTYKSQTDNPKKAQKFCKQSFLDERVMAEIVNIKEQLELIVSDMGIPISNKGTMDDYICCVSRGMIQFVCIREGRDTYRSLTAEKIQIHPGSVLFKENPQYIVAGEIVKTTRMYAMSVSPIQPQLLNKIYPNLESGLRYLSGKPTKTEKNWNNTGKINIQTDIKDKGNHNFTDSIKIGTEVFLIEKVKGKKQVILTKEGLFSLNTGFQKNISDTLQKSYKDLRGKIIWDSGILMEGEKLTTILKAIPLLPFDKPIGNNYSVLNKKNYSLEENSGELLQDIKWTFSLQPIKGKKNQLGFVCLFCDENGHFWFKLSRVFHTALNETTASINLLIDQWSENFTYEQKQTVNNLFKPLNDFYNH